MPRDPSRPPSQPQFPTFGTVLTDPRLALFGLAAGAAEAGVPLDREALYAMGQWVADGGLADVAPFLVWPFLAQGLMAKQPSLMFEALRECGALERLLPEFSALFGCIQADNCGDLVDIGRHQLRVLDQTARAGAGLHIRVAALLFNLGKADSPPQHLPTLYRHIDRCLPRIDAICARFGVAAEIREFAWLVTLELERVHRASRMRAGAVTALLERIEAFDQRQRFTDLLGVCRCDFQAYPGYSETVYPKALLLEQAFHACLAADEMLRSTKTVADPVLMHETRAQAVALAFKLQHG